MKKKKKKTFSSVVYVVGPLFRLLLFFFFKAKCFFVFIFSLILLLSLLYVQPRFFLSEQYSDFAKEKNFCSPATGKTVFQTGRAIVGINAYYVCSVQHMN